MEHRTKTFILIIIIILRDGERVGISIADLLCYPLADPDRNLLELILTLLLCDALPLLVLGVPHGDVLGPALHPLVTVLDSSSQSRSCGSEADNSEEQVKEIKHFVKIKWYLCLCVLEYLCDVMELGNRWGFILPLAALTKPMSI